MNRPDDQARTPLTRNPLATPDAVSNEPQPFPSTTVDSPEETGFADWRRRLTGNLSRRSDGPWTPLTRTHGLEQDTDPKK